MLHIKNKKTFKIKFYLQNKHIDKKINLGLKKYLKTHLGDKPKFISFIC